jgi:putative DNA methylase
MGCKNLLIHPYGMIVMIEQLFDIPFVAGLALREKQIQQNYRPLIAVHKWFARRPGTLFRALMLSEFVDSALRESFYESHDLEGLRVADPFMGGGTPLMEANRIGCDIVGCDINPMAYWIVRQEIEHLDLDAYREAAGALRSELERDIGRLYRTTCLGCGSVDAHVKYFLWVKVIPCANCAREIRLFPGYLLAQDRRHPRNVFVCAECGALNESESRTHLGTCETCGASLRPEGPAKRGRCVCPACSTTNTFPDATKGAPRHAMFAIEYTCPACKDSHQGRFFKQPDTDDLARVARACDRWTRTRARFVPTDEIPTGDESDRLHRWGYRHYHEMFNERQLLGLELSCRRIEAVKNERVRNALATNLSDLLRYQNMLCRYDAMALKSLDIFSVHGFPIGLIECESNILGIPNGRPGGNVGSGGWSNIIEKYTKAKEYCGAPFEFRHEGRHKTRVDMKGEWIGDEPNGRTGARPRHVTLVCGNAAANNVAVGSLDAVFTDPPYFGNVQYAELMDFCYVWLRKLIGRTATYGAFEPHSTRSPDELTGNVNMGRDLAHFTGGLASVFRRMNEALKPGKPLAFTYHHNDIHAYYPVAVAILDAGLACSGSVPCPAEMGASIHINGTGSSIIDTVFVCRSTGTVPKRWISKHPETIAAIVREDLDKLRMSDLKLTQGDIRCIAYGHVIRLAVWYLRKDWDASAPVDGKIGKIAEWIDNELGGVAILLGHLDGKAEPVAAQQRMVLREAGENYGSKECQLSF